MAAAAVEAPATAHSGSAGLLPLSINASEHALPWGCKYVSGLVACNLHSGQISIGVASWNACVLMRENSLS